MKIQYISIIVISFVSILSQYVFAPLLYDNHDLQQLDAKLTRMTTLLHDGAVIMTTQAIEKSEYKIGERIVVYPELINNGNKSMDICYLGHPFFVVISYQNGTVMWANGPSANSVPEYACNIHQTILPDATFIGGIHDDANLRYPVLVNPGNYTIFSVADFYDPLGKHRLVWSKPISFSIVQEKYTIADLYQLSPFKQFMAGIPATHIRCPDELGLFIRTNTGLPVCLKQDSAIKLVKRNWVMVESPNITNVIIPLGFEKSFGISYDPSLVKVVIGINNTVRWTNKANTTDTLISDGFKESNSLGEIFGGSTLGSGDSYEFTFTKEGTYGYHGWPQSWHKGKIIVLQS